MLLKFTVFVCGAAVMAIEMLALRVLAPSFGSTLQVWGALIGTFIGALSLGYWLGGVAADRWPTMRGLAVVICVSGLLICGLVPLVAPVNAFLSGVDIPEETAVWLLPLVASTVLYALPIALLGAVSPWAVRLAARDLTRLGKRVGGFYAISSLGSIFGTFFTAFYLILKAAISTISVAVGIILVALAGVVFLVGVLRKADTDGVVAPASPNQPPQT